ncbi:hypothetical protein PoB_006509000 [Plakobranchus ocellatus]|uniref:Uncharacterized protein n=1 Tax=Plakobranchus ocellatus TaxID=259542 RepID=A0AAV4D3B2_9GAST|nr:hypothetical protein PoB_006509000 [Plakobranchus ocellatus]
MGRGFWRGFYPALGGGQGKVKIPETSSVLKRYKKLELETQTDTDVEMDYGSLNTYSSLFQHCQFREELRTLKGRRQSDRS